MGAFSATTRMSGVDLAADASRADGGARRLRKGAAPAVAAWVQENGGTVPAALDVCVKQVSASGGTPSRSPSSRRTAPRGCWVSSTSRTW